jgi:5S rRNA maturation endonuclease (ribonuclease M5)
MHGNPVSNAVLKVLSRLPDAKQNGRSWMAKCPCHDDGKASLSISQGDDGRALVNCFAGCSVDNIVASIGLTKADLFDDSTRRNGHPAPKSAHNASSNGQSPKSQAFATSDEALAELVRRQGPYSRVWPYHDANGVLIGLVVRWDLPDGGKDIRPLSLRDDGWHISGMIEPRPLYCLPELAGASRVYVCEGEKAADAVRSIGLVATTSPNGSNSANKADWSSLAGKEIIILPDNDPPGQKYADAVAAILATIAPAPVVKVVELPNLPHQGDAHDFVAEHTSSDIGEIRTIVETLANEAKSVNVTAPPVTDCWVPFPVEALPNPLRILVIAGAKAIGCDPSYIALPLLTVMSAAIGTTRRLELKRGWEASVTLWVAIVGESGTSKTPAFKLAMRAIRKMQYKALTWHQEKMAEYQTSFARYEKAHSQWKRSKSEDDPPDMPEIPKAVRYVVSDTTVEALAPMLLANPRGVLLSRDELAGWIGSFDRYASGKGGADASHWLSMHNGDSIIVDRKTGFPRTIFVKQAAVSVCGGIQPGILNRALGKEHRESGLAARLLLTCPPRLPKRWTDADIDPALETDIEHLLDRLLELQPTHGVDGEPRAVVIRLTPEAKELFKAFYNEHADEQVELTGDLSAAWSKLEEYAARLALIVHFVRWAANDPTLADPDEVDAVSMEAGITLTNWFKNEARRVYSLLGESDGDRDQRRLFEWLTRKGCPMTAREVQQGCRWIDDAAAAETALNALAKAGLGYWELSPPGQRGQPTRRFRLSTPSTVYGNTSNPMENGNTVDVDTVDEADSGTHGDAA